MIQFFMRTERGVCFLLILTAIMWGGNVVAAKFVVQEIPPIATAFIRFAGVSIFLLSLVFILEGKKAIPVRSQIVSLTSLAVTGVFLNNVFFFTGVKYSAAINASLLMAINPVITVSMTAIFLKETLRMQQLAGIALSLLGVCIVVTKGSWEIASQLTFNDGDLMLLTASASWTIYSIIGRKVMKEISPLAATAWATLIGALMLGIAAVWEGFRGNISLSGTGWISMIYMILCSGGAAFYWWNHGITVIGPNRVSIFTNIIPLSGMLFASILLKESIVGFQMIGAAFIIAGVWLTNQTTGKVLQQMSHNSEGT